MHGITCRTTGCENEGYTLIVNRPGHTIICGPCGQPIVDIDPPLPAEPYPYDDPTVEGVIPDGNPE